MRVAEGQPRHSCEGSNTPTPYCVKGNLWGYLLLGTRERESGGFPKNKHLTYGTIGQTVPHEVDSLLSGPGSMQKSSEE